MSRPRCVFDTNVLISALLSPSGLPLRLLRHVLEEADLLMSAAALDELASRLQRPKFDAYVAAEDRDAFVRTLRRRAERVVVGTVVTACSDPDDNHILALAVDDRADVLVTGDRKHLLPLHPFRGIQILAPRELADRIGIL